MDKESAHSGEQDETQELTALLRVLRVEATPEAYFEERFLQDFRRRVEREMVCRPMHSLVWEHISMLMDHFGMRRVALSASAFGLGALCVGTLVWRSAPSTVVKGENLCELESRANSLQPGVSRQVVSTTVHTGRARRVPKRNVVVLVDDEEDPLYAGTGLEDTTLHGISTNPWAEDGAMLMSSFK